MINEKLSFTNFKIHTQYSICEGAIKIDDLAHYCKENTPTAPPLHSCTEQHI